MLGNSPQSIGNLYEQQGRASRIVGAWLTPEYDFTPDADEVRRFNDKDPTALLSRTRGIARHAGRIIQSKVIGTERTLSLIERVYGDSDLAIINPAPTWLQQQAKRGIKYPLIPPLWALYRDREREPLQRIGVYPKVIK